jgi:copper(I)-binding protein
MLRRSACTLRPARPRGVCGDGAESLSDASHHEGISMRSMRAAATLTLAVAGLALAQSAAAQVTVVDAWVRGTVAGQKATGAFMQLQSANDAALVEAASPAAKIVEIHEMKMEGGVMKMRAVDKLPLPAGKAVDLKPGGYHVMLLDLVKALKEGDVVPLKLTFEDKAGKKQTIEVNAKVMPLAAGGAPR